MSVSKIVFLKAKSQYELQTLFLHELEAALTGLGKEVVTFDVNDPGAAGPARRALRSSIDFIFFYNALAFDSRSALNIPFDSVGAPVITWLIDHPYHHLNRLSNHSGAPAVVCVDRNHVRFIDSFFKGSLPSFFIPHFGIKAVGLEEARERDIDILIPASFVDSSKLHDKWKTLPDTVFSLLRDICDAALSRDCVPLEDVVLDVFKARGVPADERLYVQTVKVLREVDVFIRQRRRERLLETLARAGVAADVYGAGFENHTLARYHRAHGQVNLADMIRLMGRAKIVVNAGPNFCDGSHERVLSAMRNGAVAVTDGNDYWSGEFTEGKELITYRWSDLDALTGKIESLLSRPAVLQEMAEAGRKKADRRHTPMLRALQLLEVANL